MPYIPNADQDEEQPLQGAVAPGAPGTRTSAPSGVGGAGASGSPTPQNAGGQFATLQSYLSANQGQAAPLANKITSGIQNQYNTLQGQNESTLSGIGSQVASSAVPTNSSDILAQEAANPVSFSGDQGNVKQFQGLLNASYGGPTSAEGTPEYQKQQAAVNNAIATGTAQTGTEAGREQLLSQNERRPTTGVTALNSAILTQSPDYLSQVQGAYKPFANLVSGLSSGAQDINKNITKTQGDVSATNAAANKQIADQVNKFSTGLQDTFQQGATQAKTYNDLLNQFTTQLNPIENSLRGYEGGAGVTVVDPFSQYTAIKPVNAPSTIESIAKPSDFQLQQALSQIGGTPIQTLNPALISQAGTYQAAPSFVAPNINDLTGQLAAQARLATIKQNPTLSGFNNVNPNGLFNKLLQQLSPYTNDIYKAPNNSGYYNINFDKLPPNLWQ